MTPLALAWKTAARYRARAVLAVAGVATIGALNFDMLLLSRGLLISFEDLLTSTGFDVRIVANSGVPLTRFPIDGAAALADQVRRLPEVQAAALVKTEPATVVVGGNAPVSIELVATTDRSSSAAAWTVVRGAGLPHDSSSTERPIVVSQRLAALLRLNPGSELSIRSQIDGGVSVLPAVPFRVVGIADFRLEAVDQYVGATTYETLQRASGGTVRDDADMVLVASTPAAGPAATAAAIGRLRPDLRAFSNEQLVASFNRNGFAYFRQVSLALSSTTALFTFLLVATLLTVSANQRLGEVAALRALGIARRRIAATLLWESALLVGAGGLLALPLGLALAALLDRILRQMPGLPEGLHFFVFEPRALVWHAVMLGGTAVVAAIYPMWLAVSLPIAATLRREIVS